MTTEITDAQIVAFMRRSFTKNHVLGKEMGRMFSPTEIDEMLTVPAGAQLDNFRAFIHDRGWEAFEAVVLAAALAAGKQHE